jgi:hypothetical protein
MEKIFPTVRGEVIDRILGHTWHTSSSFLGPQSNSECILLLHNAVAPRKSNPDDTNTKPQYLLLWNKTGCLSLGQMPESILQLYGETSGFSTILCSV